MRSCIIVFLMYIVIPVGDQIGLSHLGHMLAQEWAGHSGPNRGHTGHVALSPQK